MTLASASSVAAAAASFFFYLPHMAVKSKGATGQVGAVAMTGAKEPAVLAPLAVQMSAQWRCR